MVLFEAMTMIVLESLLIVLLILINGVLVMAETAILYASKARLAELAKAGSASAQLAIKLASNPNSFLAPIQVGITLVAITAGAFGGATIAVQLGDHIAHALGRTDHVYPIAFALVVVSITYVSLIVGELGPRRIAMAQPEALASFFARPVQFAARLGGPFLRVVEVTVNALAIALGAKGAPRQPVTEEEVKTLIEQGTQTGVFDKEEGTILKKVLRVGDQKVGDIMTPRLKLVGIDLNEPWEKTFQKMQASPHSYFPVHHGTLDNIVGLVSIKVLWTKHAAGTLSATAVPPPLKETLIKPLYVMETIPVLKVLELFKQSGKHIAIVVDEYGGTAGLITVIDVLEAIVGDLPVAKEAYRSGAVRREDGSWLVDGLMPIAEFKELFSLQSMPGEDEGDFQTLGGFMMMKIGRIPTEADTFRWNGIRFEVVDMDGHRVDKAMVTPRRPDLADADEEEES